MRSFTLGNIFLKTLRDNRSGMLAWGAGMGLLMALTTSQYTQLIGVGAERQRMAAEAAKAFQAFSFLIGDITSLDTLGGFVTTRVLGFIPVVIGLWAAVVGAGLIRGEEQTGALDVLLSTPHGRRSVLAQKVGALGLALLVVSVLILVGLMVGSIITNEPLPADGLLLTLLNILAIGAFWGVVGLLAS